MAEPEKASDRDRVRQQTDHARAQYVRAIEYERECRFDLAGNLIPELADEREKPE